MKIALYDNNGTRLPDFDLPDAIFQACVALDGWMAAQPNQVSVYGLGRVVDRDARIAELEAAIDKLAHKGGGSYINVADYKALIKVRNKTLHK